MSLEEKFKRAEQFRIEGQYESALPIYREILDTDGDHVEARVSLGLTLCFVGEFDESIDELKKAADIAPEFAWAQLNLGKTYQMLGMFEESRAPLEKVLAIADAEPRYKEEAQKQLDYLKEFGL